MRILVTNDDGVFAPGIGALTAALADAGHDVTVVAPLEDHSGSSAATGLQLQRSVGTLRFEAVELPAVPGVPAIGVAALPSVCVSLALTGTFGAPRTSSYRASTGAGTRAGSSCTPERSALRSPRPNSGGRPSRSGYRRRAPPPCTTRPRPR